MIFFGNQSFRSLVGRAVEPENGINSAVCLFAGVIYFM